MLVNDSILHLFITYSTGTKVLTTIDGGNKWEEFLTGPPNFLKFNYVNTNLTYCFTKNGNELFITGIGMSSLSKYKDSLTVGTHYISDLGANIIDIDSTIIEINDSIDFVILFN